MSEGDTGLWPAPAKLNLFLHITGRRADGYHLLQTVFQFLDRCDLLRFEPRGDSELRLHANLPGVAAEDNLIIRAAQRLREHVGSRQGAEIFLDKRLPAGGGLGGGSSDAATTLHALNLLWGLDLDEDVLADIGIGLGADVPVFVRGRAAWAEGVGEKLTPVDPPEPWYAVLVPDCAVSTAAVFQDPELTRDTPPTTIPAFSFRGGRNDCESVVRARFPVVGQALDALSAHGQARLTGTGACVFAAFDERESAMAALLACERAGWQGFVARGCNCSPLLGRLPVNSD